MIQIAAWISILWLAILSRTSALQLSGFFVFLFLLLLKLRWRGIFESPKFRKKYLSVKARVYRVQQLLIYPSYFFFFFCINHVCHSHAQDPPSFTQIPWVSRVGRKFVKHLGLWIHSWKWHRTNWALEASVGMSALS